MKFREKLKNSFQYACARTERMLLDLAMESMRFVPSAPTRSFVPSAPTRSNYQCICFYP